MLVYKQKYWIYRSEGGTRISVSWIWRLHDLYCCINWPVCQL